ncbi:MAG: Triacylglycerol lipase [Nocardia sp.]|uniref:lipase family protein n=1 Tax=Nocardia sp. TaxID=1821 RepID=UPI00260B6B84|nr:lipase family protein [Nocardia sp.]MCU1641740.1 Triacylglycerol lipase [Nocardia sp.]
MTEFYAPLVAESDRRPGELLRTQSTSIRNLGDTTRAWRIVYVSSDSRGELIPASGTVISDDPITDSGPKPIAVYSPSFHGLGGECAPSQQLVRGSEPLDQIQAALDRGWTVAVPDGENLGITGLGPHTFLAARAGGHVMLDLARATHALPELQTPDAGSAPIVLWGYADGGRAAVSAAELHREYAPELHLRGVAAGAVVTDPGALVLFHHRGPWSALALAGLIGLSRAYHHLPLRHVLTEDGLRIIRHAETLSAAVLLEQYRQPLEHWCERLDPWNDAIWRYVLTRESRSAAATPAVPVHLYHGTNDLVVPIEFGSRLHTEYRQRGVDVSWCEYDTNHFRTAAESAPEVVEELARFLGRPPIGPTRQPGQKQT